MEKVNGMEVVVSELIANGITPKEESTKLVDQPELLQETGVYTKGGGKVASIIPKHVKEKNLANRKKVLIAYAVMLSNGIPIDLERYDKVIAEDAAALEGCIEICNEYNRDLLTLEDEKPKVHLNVLDEKHIKSKNGYREVNDLFKSEYPEVATAIKALQDQQLFSKYVKRQSTLHTPSQPFYTATGRCQYSFSTDFDGPLMVLPKRYRYILDPKANIYCVDLTAAEMGVVAALSGDMNMQADYSSEDIYLSFIKNSGLDIGRDLAKILLLGITKGMSAWGIAHRARITEEKAQELLDKVKEHYSAYMRWAEAEAGITSDEDGEEILDKKKVIWAPLGITNYSIVKNVAFEKRINSAMSFRAQALVAVILYRTVVKATREGLTLVATLHDSIYVKSEDGAKRVKELFEESSIELLTGFKLKNTIERCE